MHEQPEQLPRHSTYEWVLVNGKLKQMEIVERARFPRVKKQDVEEKEREKNKRDDQEFKTPQSQSTYGKGSHRFASLQQTN